MPAYEEAEGSSTGVAPRAYLRFGRKDNSGKWADRPWAHVAKFITHGPESGRSRELRGQSTDLAHDLEIWNLS